jgi:ABC-type multidrug transport system fused ATPase/permease subunit
LRYRPDTEIVLKGLTFKVNSGEKIGIVGRTGAGKSTISLAITRIVEIFQG